MQPNRFSSARFWNSIAVAGWLLIILVLLADTLGLSAKGVSRGQILVFLVGLFVMAVGLLRERIVKIYQTVAVLLLNTIVLMIVLEIGAGVVSWIVSTEPDNTLPESDKMNLSYYQAQDWSAQYWAEFSASFIYVYQPFVGWRRPPFDGKYIKVDNKGHRVTPGTDCQDGSYRVFAFGGSTMWGTGAPDWGTIPAYLLQGLDEELDQPICIINFGESAHVNNQEVIALTLELKAGRIPDMVIFYDGINDVYAAYQSGRVDAHQNLGQLASVFSGKNEQSLLDHTAETIRNQSYFVRLLDRYVLKDDEEGEQELITYRTMGIETDELAGALVDNYLQNYALVENLASDYEFDVAFFWQPTMPISQKTLTAEEQFFADRQESDLVALYQATYNRMAEEDHPDLYDLSHVLDDSEESLWIDFTHVTPVGNEIIAGAMLEAIR